MRFAMILGLGVVSAAVMTSPVLASQHQPGTQAQTGGQATSPPPPGMSPGMVGGGAMGTMCPMMGTMMHQMTGGRMGPSMMGGMGMVEMGGMGMMGGGQMDPKTMGRMLQLRAEMLRAMSDVMLKHGKAMSEGK